MNLFLVDTSAMYAARNFEYKLYQIQLAFGLDELQIEKVRQEALRMGIETPMSAIEALDSFGLKEINRITE